MFILLIALAWSTVIVGAIFLLTFSVLTLTASMWMTTTMFASTAGKGNFLYKLFLFLSNNPIRTPIFKMGNESLATATSGGLFTGGINPWIINPGALMALKNGGGAEGAFGFHQWKVILMAGLLLSTAIGMITISVIELIRLKKRQKISRPYVKAILVVLPVLLLIYGQMVTIIAAVCLLEAWLLLEAVLFDSEALNNYAEERNLISIYKEERKFEREVNKEGKLTGNVDLEILNQENQKNMLDQNGKAKANDNSALPKKPNKEKQAKYLAHREELAKLREELLAKESELEDKDKKRLKADFDKKIRNLNFYAKTAGGISTVVEPLKWANYVEEEKVEKLNTTVVENPKHRKAYEQWKEYRQKLEMMRAGVMQKAPSMSAGEKDKISKKFNGKVMRVNALGKKLKLPDEYQIPFLVLDGSGQTATLNGEASRFESAPTSAPSTQSFEQPNLSQPNGAPLPKSAPKESGFVQNANFQTGSIDEATAAFGGISSTAIDPNIEDLHTKYSAGSKPETFVLPQTTVHGVGQSKAELEALMKARMAYAVNMNMTQIPVSKENPNADEKSIMEDFNFKQPDLMFQVVAKEAAKIKALEERAAANGTTATGTITAPPMFGTIEDFGSEEPAAFVAPGTEQLGTFVAPQTKTHGVGQSKAELEALMKARMAYAVNMNMTQIPVSKENPNADEKSIMEDFNFKQPDLMFQVVAKEAAKIKALEERAAANGTTATGTITAPPMFGTIEDFGSEEPAAFVAPGTEQLGTFVAPQTKTHGVGQSKAELEALMKARMAYAVNMNMTQIPVSNEKPNADEKSVMEDLNFKQPDLMFQVVAKEAAKIKALEERAAANGTTATGTITAPPMFGTIEDFGSEEPAAFVAPGTEQIGTFVAPQTKVHGANNSKAEIEALMKAKMAYAINMDLNQLPVSGEKPNADEKSIMVELDFKQPDLMFQVVAKEAAKIKALEERAAANGTTTGTISAPPMFGSMDDVQPSAPAPSFEPSQPSAPAPSFEPSQPSAPAPSFAQPTTPTVSAISDNKVGEIEQRMARLEAALSSFEGDQLRMIQEQFTMIKNQLEVVSKNIESMKTSDPMSIIDSLTRRHAYNQK
ncbi:hypothetical protein SCHIN_v1c11740 [Spiroplasma chinense]|uniref:Uncharacterized protein n=1 Tax=Spiroplasma chinense TaxID=216932 RepID=A0A5B9Y7R7_9MOLU|nr:hypothetical protein [Spiroplasma chinense]QEH62367.1 hypothetical protein SCHIN_v1c11740 [Spiroplasma chinense]